ncbi:MAG: DUF1800 domain-containing protein [Thermostichales cyanobacterium SZTDM-1c_bins_54]
MERGHFWRRLTGGGRAAELHSTVPLAVLWQGWLHQTQPPVSYPDLTLAGGEALKPTVHRRLQLQRFFEWWTTQKIQAVNPLHERMVDFWRDYFTVSARMGPVAALLDYEQRLRTHALGDFQELLWSVSTSPMMLIYLNNGENRRGHLNENFSRELLELFTVGPGHYTEQDIQEGARALTGWRLVRAEPGQISSDFFPKRHDPGSKTYLGRTGTWKPEDIIDILANHPATGQRLGYKLWSTLVYPNPEPEIVTHLSQVYQGSRRQIPAVLEAIFTHPAFFSPRAYRSRVKSPQEFLMGSLRALEIEFEPQKVLLSLRQMGNHPYGAPTVKGWPDSWVTTTSLLNRLSLAQDLTAEWGNDGGFAFAPEKFGQEELLRLLLDGEEPAGLSQDWRRLDRREQAAVLLSSPVYQLI